MAFNDDAQKVVQVISCAGGKVIGRVKLQKMVCLLQLAGCDLGFRFFYHYYGPYSEDLTEAIDYAKIFNKVREEEPPTPYGGSSVYSVAQQKQLTTNDFVNEKIVALATKANAVSSTLLELAVTAAYLFKFDNAQNPWELTSKLKKSKADDGRLEKAKKLYDDLRAIAPGLPILA